MKLKQSNAMRSLKLDKYQSPKSAFLMHIDYFFIKQWNL